MSRELNITVGENAERISETKRYATRAAVGVFVVIGVLAVA